MAIEKLDILRFLEMAKDYPVLDVRSPAEYNHAHIPGAFNLPLFSDEQRKEIGTIYKQQNRKDAIKIGLKYFGPIMLQMVEKVEALIEKRPLNIKNGIDKPQTSNTVLVHCWRGGMRSAAVAWLLDLYGFKVFSLIGGYKKFRHYVLESFLHPYNFKVVGGYTGSGKTHVLKELERNGKAIIDLEHLAHHKGSAFGALGQPLQPSQEMFENKLALELMQAIQTDSDDNGDDYHGYIFNKSIWIEDESQRIGKINLPQPIWARMRGSQLYFLDIPFEERLNHIITEYGNLDSEKMVNAIIRIRKRLGGLETKNAINALIEGNLEECFAILLSYYDKWYSKGLNNRDNLDSCLTKIPCMKVAPPYNARLLLQVFAPSNV